MHENLHEASDYLSILGRGRRARAAPIFDNCHTGSTPQLAAMRSTTSGAPKFFRVRVCTTSHQSHVRKCICALEIGTERHVPAAQAHANPLAENRCEAMRAPDSPDAMDWTALLPAAGARVTAAPPRLAIRTARRTCLRIGLRIAYAAAKATLRKADSARTGRSVRIGWTWAAALAASSPRWRRCVRASYPARRRLAQRLVSVPALLLFLAAGVSFKARAGNGDTRQGQR